MAPIDDDDLDRFDDQERDSYEEALDECGMTRDGLCMYAGTEHCDFECPFHDDYIFNVTHPRDSRGRFIKKCVEKEVT